MKISKKQLLKIIAEQVKEALPEHPEDVEVVEDSWAGGDNLELDVDYSKISAGEPNVASPEVLELVVAEVRKRIQEKAVGQTKDKDPALFEDTLKSRLAQRLAATIKRTME